MMRAVGSRNTTPELALRKLLSSAGYRYQSYAANLPGTPDIVFPRRKKAIFLHGCFWHGHSCKRGARIPKTNRKYWVAKIDRNRARDTATLRFLKKEGWRALTVWECQLRTAAPKIFRFLERK